MATLTSKQLAENRQDVARNVSVIDYDKSTINSALQAIEDMFENTTRGQFLGAVNAAMAPFVPSDEQRNAIIDAWLKQKGRGAS